MKRTTQFHLFILLLFTFSCIHTLQAQWWKDLLDPTISHWDAVSSGNKNLSVSQALTEVLGYVVAFGDVNNDKFTDLFIYSYYQVSVFEWIAGSKAYSSIGSSVTGDSTDEILSVIPSDFNYDGYLDIVVHSCDDSKCYLTVYFGLGNGTFVDPLPLSPNPSTQQVLLFDANMDMLVDLFGTDENNNRIYWINGNTSWTSQPQSASPLNPISSPHSNAFVDISGDCLSDLVVFSESQGNKSMELWINDGQQFVYNTSYPLPVGAGQFSFADFDKDGTMDIVFPVCYPEITCANVNEIYIVYNTQPPMCTSITGTGTNCTAPGSICEDNGFSLPPMDTLASNSDVVIIPTSAFGAARFLWTFPVTANSTAPATLRVGDFNQDGYPDLMFQLVLNNISTAQLYESIPCSSDIEWCTADAISSGRRTFQAYQTGVDALTNYQNVFASTFLDIGDDGTLDMLVMTISPSSPEGGDPQRRHINAIENGVDWGTFFLKVLGLNGLCLQWCSSEPAFPDPRPVGVNQPGVVFKYIYTNNDGEKEVAVGNQLIQSAYLSLQTPYVYFGLGSVSNYIQNLYMGVPITGGSRHYGSTYDIIPNSQVAAYPSPPTSPRRWKFDILLRPSGLTFWTVLTSVIICSVLAFLAVYFAWREKKQDREERKEKAHLFKL